MKMKKFLLTSLVVATAALILSGTTSCKDSTKSVAVTPSDSDTLAVGSTPSSSSVSSSLPRTLVDAPAPKGKIVTWLTAGYTEDGYPRMFIVEEREGRLVLDNLESTDTIYLLRLVSYQQTEDEKENTEEGGTFESFGGPLVVDAYNPKTQEFVGRYEGSYEGGCEYDASGELLHGGESYSGTFTRANGKTEDFSYYGD